MPVRHIRETPNPDEVEENLEKLAAEFPDWDFWWTPNIWPHYCAGRAGEKGSIFHGTPEDVAGQIRKWPKTTIEFKPGLEAKKEAQEIFKAVNDLYNLLSQRDMLIVSLEAGLKEMRSQLTDILSPYSVEELDLTVKKQDERFPEYEHWYTRCGTGVAWHGNPKSPEHRFWRSISPESIEAREEIVKRLNSKRRA